MSQLQQLRAASSSFRTYSDKRHVDSMALFEKGGQQIHGRLQVAFVNQLERGLSSGLDESEGCEKSLDIRGIVKRIGRSDHHQAVEPLAHV